MKKLMMRLLLVVLLVVALAQVTSATTATMELVSGPTTVIITDNGGGDSNPAVGGIIYSNTNLNGWSVVVTSGSSNSPGVSPFGIALLSVTATSTGPNELDIYFGDKNFSVPADFQMTFSLTKTGTGTGSGTEKGWVDNTNTGLPLPGGTPAGGLIGTIGPFSTSNTGTVVGGPKGVPLYGLTLEEILKDTSGTDVFTANGILSPTPEVSTMLLFGTGFLAVGFAMRRRRAVA